MDQSPSTRRRDNRRQRILTIALDAFLENGYANTSMSAIAALVGGSKGTLYNHFSTKEELFLACIQSFIESHSQQTFSAIDEGGAPTRVLGNFCRFFIAAITSKTDLALTRLVIAEAGRFPAIGRTFYQSGPVPGVARLATYIAQAMAAGQLRRDDAERAALLLFSLCQSRIYQEVLFNVSKPPGAKKIAAEADAAVATFMVLYGIR